MIDIPDAEYERIQAMDWKNGDKWYSCEAIAIHNGTPLPKGHGRLIDADDVKENHKRWIGYLDEDMIARLNIAIDKHVPTIIEADKDGKEE